MDVSVARYINDQRGWFVISDELFDYYDQDDAYEVAKAYRCFHCGIILKCVGVVVHKDSCEIGADERLNESLFALQYCADSAKANNGLGRRVEIDIFKFLDRYR